MALKSLLLSGHRTGHLSQSRAMSLMQTPSLSTQHALVCNVYISEGQDERLIARLQAIANEQPATVLAHTFVDRAYNRTGFTIAAWDAAQLTSAVVQLSAAALSSLDLRLHTATHPRVGAVDHISVHPISINANEPPSGADGRGMLAAVQVVHQVATRLAHPPWSLPCYLYGAAHHEARRLADIRRQLGYFKPSGSKVESSQPGQGAGLGQSVWSGPNMIHGQLPMPPDLGPGSISDRWGVLTIGARPWVTNYNVPLRHPESVPAAKEQQGSLVSDLLSKGRLIARAVSERGGGLAGVEAMALPHDAGCVEIACNLLDARVMTPHQVQMAVERLAGSHGLTPGAGYLTGLTPEQLIQKTVQALGPPV